MLIACACVVLTAIKELNNALMWLVRAMPGIALEFVEGVGLRLVQLPGNTSQCIRDIKSALIFAFGAASRNTSQCIRDIESALMVDFQRIGFPL